MARPRGTTIVAIASPPGSGARGVLRLSGPASAALLERVCRRGGAPFVPAARGAFDVELDDGVAPLPALALWFPGPGSFTREDVAELHVPGAAPLVRRALARLLALGATLAEPGEFTRRAFTNGRIDLTRAEGVLALVEARTHGERRAATALLLGGLEARTAEARAELDEARALAEASLDFDEADTGHVPAEELAAAVARAAALLREASRFEAARERERGEARVVLVGEPNAGKSSLFNALTAAGAVGAAEDAALVAPVRGTTRDTKAALARLGGRRVTLVDTAGLELEPAPGEHGPASPAADPLARLAEARTLGARAGADLLVWVVDATAPGLTSSAHRARALGASHAPFVVAWNQVDRPGAAPAPVVAGAEAVVATSATTPQGSSALAAAIAAALAPRGEGAAGRLALAVRTEEALRAAASDLAAGAAALADGLPLDLVAQHLRDATARLDAVSGRTTPEDLLDRIFARFCLGK